MVENFGADCLHLPYLDSVFSFEELYHHLRLMAPICEVLCPFSFNSYSLRI